MTVEAAREILQRLLERPEISDEVNKYVFSWTAATNSEGTSLGTRKDTKGGMRPVSLKAYFWAPWPGPAPWRLTSSARNRGGQAGGGARDGARPGAAGQHGPRRTAPKPG